MDTRLLQRTRETLGRLRVQDTPQPTLFGYVEDPAPPGRRVLWIARRAPVDLQAALTGLTRLPAVHAAIKVEQKIPEFGPRAVGCVGTVTLAQEGLVRFAIGRKLGVGGSQLQVGLSRLATTLALGKYQVGDAKERTEDDGELTLDEVLLAQAPEDPLPLEDSEEEIEAENTRDRLLKRYRDRIGALGQRMASLDDPLTDAEAEELGRAMVKLVALDGDEETEEIQRLGDALIDRRKRHEEIRELQGVTYSRQFARLLASDDRGAPNQGQVSMPLETMTRYLAERSLDEGDPYRAEYALVEKELEFAWEVSDSAKKLAVGSLLGSVGSLGLLAPIPFTRPSRSSLGGRTFDRLLDEGVVCVPIGWPGHAMMLEVKKVGTDDQGDLYRIRIFNSGYGSERHVQGGGNKYHTAYEVTGVRVGDGSDHLNAGEMRRILDRMILLRHGVVTGDDKHVERIYRWADKKGTPNGNPPTPLQTGQKGGDCAIESIMAYLRATLSEPAYKAMKARLMREAAGALEDRDGLQKNRKLREKLRAKATSAETHKFWRDQAQACLGETWCSGFAGHQALGRRLKQRGDELHQAVYTLFFDAGSRRSPALAWYDPANDEKAKFLLVSYDAENDRFTFGENNAHFATLAALGSLYGVLHHRAGVSLPEV